MSDVHVVPLHDLIEHAVPGGLPPLPAAAGSWLAVKAVDAALPCDPCPCGPAFELVTGDADTPDGWLVVHHSLDGREGSEHANGHTAADPDEGTA